MLAIIGAMDIEVEELKAEMDNPKVVKIAGMEFYQGEIYGKSVVVVKCGIGKVNAAVCTQILVDQFEIDAVINTGVAGALNREINIGDIVISKEAIEHDFDVRALGYQRGVIPQMDDSKFQSDERLVQLAMECVELSELNVRAFLGRIVSGDQFIAEKEKKDDLVSEFQGDCAEMEGASVAHVAYLNRIPCIIIRAISDKADGSADMDYPTFEAMAAKNSVAILKEMIKRF